MTQDVADEVPAEVVPAPKLSLAQILEALTRIDNLNEAEFDPAVLAENLQDKVDAIYTVYDRLNSEASRLDKIAADFFKAANVAWKAADRLKDYVLWNMQQQNFQKLPGNVFSFIVMPNNPKVIVEKNPTPEDFLKYSAVVKRDTVYSWDKKQLSSLIKDGAKFPFAKLETGQRVEFKIRKEKT